jgi:hypothetical protein
MTTELPRESHTLTVSLHLRVVVVSFRPDGDLVTLGCVRQRIRALWVQLCSGVSSCEAASQRRLAPRALELVKQDGLQRAHLLLLVGSVVYLRRVRCGRRRSDTSYVPGIGGGGTGRSFALPQAGAL